MDIFTMDKDLSAMTDPSCDSRSAAAGQEETPESVAPPVKPPRIMSVDALRGFDMFWIIGGQEFFTALAALLCFSGGVPGWLAYHLEHVEWTGFAAWDLIMPLFLFVSGVSIPFALALKARETRDWKVFYRRLARRVFLLWVFGMIAQGHLLEFHTTTIHFYSNTLQAIAVGYVIAVLAFVYLRLRTQIFLCTLLLAVYWLLMMFVPVPGAARWVLEPELNLALWLDTVVLGRFRDGTTYAWILPGFGFGASVLLGSFAGQVLKSSSKPLRRFWILIALGIGCLAAGWVWSLHFPIIKHLWTSSMVLWAGGWSFLLLALFYLVIDILEWRRWAYPFVVIGANAIAVYMAVHLVRLDKLVGGLPFLAGDGELRLLAASFTALLIVWVPLWIMYKRKIFLRV